MEKLLVVISTDIKQYTRISRWPPWAVQDSGNSQVIVVGRGHGESVGFHNNLQVDEKHEILTL
ncbi:hypothetical protein F4212_06360 [Candidatus Poribacteria bacterium]|nr:hypothetical protein [Candidatus Poribacteria bacterium]